MTVSVVVLESHFLVRGFTLARGQRQANITLQPEDSTTLHGP